MRRAPFEIVSALFLEDSLAVSYGQNQRLLAAFGCHGAVEKWRDHQQAKAVNNTNNIKLNFYRLITLFVSWGRLKRDHGSQPKHIRKVKLARFDPNNPPKAPKLAGAMSKFSPFDPNFWATPDVYILDDEQQYFAKKVYNEASRESRPGLLV
ncbi:unnamed protein product [Allacma fusca]|uniref:Uncharacterized protein n=1 Tax=Allacma fusca TaxID=39272 RepID=A0A8J2JMH4_9HEXA|nr:unnamed protein product [Allacma fusca]